MTSFPVVVVSSFAVVGLVLLTAGWLIEMEPKGKHTARAVAIRVQADRQTIEVARTRNSPPAAMMEEGIWKSTATAGPGCAAPTTANAAAASSTSATAPVAVPSPRASTVPSIGNPAGLAGLLGHGEYRPVRGSSLAVRPGPGRHRASDRDEPQEVQLVDGRL